MASVVTNNPEIEYAVMLAVLDFQREFMRANYSRIEVHICDELIEVTLGVPFFVSHTKPYSTRVKDSCVNELRAQSG
jgi:hypothetical protein